VLIRPKGLPEPKSKPSREKVFRRHSMPAKKKAVKKAAPKKKK
jgi:hypothetical protein